MKHFGMFGLLVVAMAALMASAGSAAATTLTTSAGETPFVITGASEGHVVFHSQIEEVECILSTGIYPEKHGAGIPVSGKVAPHFSCKNEWQVKNEEATPLGTLSVTALGEGNGTLTSSGSTIKAISPMGNICRYVTSNTHIGTVTVEEAMTTVNLEAEVPFHSGGPLCGTEPVPLTGSFKVTLPKILGIH